MKQHPERIWWLLLALMGLQVTVAFMWTALYGWLA